MGGARPGGAPPKQETRGQRETSVSRGAEAARTTSFVLGGSSPQPVVLRAVAAVLAGGRECCAVP